MYTPLHRALGIEPCPLTMDLFRGAVAARVAERDDLDWKQVLPQHPGSWVEEFSKDVAAMANAGGGMIVYGVAEERSTSEAAAISDVGSITDSTLREMRAAAFSGVTPPVLGLQLVPVQDPENSESVLALLIPPSDDTPHLVFRQDMFGAPLRLGSQTGWMKERMLESAYRQRLAERDRRLIGLDELFEESAAPFRQAPRVWMVAVARPEIQGNRGRISGEVARTIFSASSQIRPINFGGLSPLGQLQHRVSDAVLGLRRWTVQTNHFNEDAVYGCRISLHFDGSIAVAMAVAGGRLSDTRSEVDITAIEAVLIDLAGVAGAASRELSILGGYVLKASLLSNGSEMISLRIPPPFQEVWPNRGVAYEPDPSPVASFVPITGALMTNEGQELVLEGLREAALDLINQAGVWKLQMLQPGSGIEAETDQTEG